MSIQELLDLLNKMEDKTKPVKMCTDDGEEFDIYVNNVYDGKVILGTYYED